MHAYPIQSLEYLLIYPPSVCPQLLHVSIHQSSCQEAKLVFTKSFPMEVNIHDILDKGEHPRLKK